MEKTRCKFVVNGIERNECDTSAILEPVMYDENENYDVPEENKQFWEATPSGKLELFVTNKSLDDMNIGDEFYIDLIPVEK